MIVTLEGRVVEHSPLRVVLEISGIGYEVHIPLATSECIPAIGQSVKLYTVAVYREDAQLLYGFHNQELKEFFKLLVEKVSGVGPKMALAILSKLALPILQAAIFQEDANLLAQCPGIGKKTAERMIVELKDKMGTLSISTSSGSSNSSALRSFASSPQADAVEALMALGYKAADADQRIRKAISHLGGEVSIEALIKTALN